MEQKQTYKKDIFAIILGAIQVLAILFVIVINFMAGGYSQGFFDLDDVLFEGISSFGNMSDYDRLVEAGSVYSFLAFLILGGILLLVFWKSKARKELPAKLGTRIAAQLISNVLFLAFSFLLILYTFDGVTRVILYPVMLFSAGLYLYVTAKCSIRVGATAVILQIVCFLAAFWLVWVICPLIGSIFTIFGDIASAFVVLLLLTGGSASSSRMIKIIII